jgi:type IV secretory pathway TraG/TraD family ATPase VirD4
VRLSGVLDASANAGHGVYLGHGEPGWCFAQPEQSVMILGPPRSGKTSSLIIPNVMASNGPVVSTSTKPDVLEATCAVRGQRGECLVFDPTGAVGARGHVQPLRWSPLQSCTTWTTSLAMARSLVEVGASSTLRGGGRAESSHWTERAQALLAPLLHAASLDEADMRTLLTWVDRRQALPAQQILAGEPGRSTELARNLLDGIVTTDERELSGIWSTASGALTGFRSDQALEAMSHPDFDADSFVRSADTVYIAAPADRQGLVAPMVVGLIEDIRRSTYARQADCPTGTRPGPPVLMALDEVANIAPLPDLPAMISEGGGQGLTTMACLQDLSQARNRWPSHAEGFPSLFGTTVVLPGIGDVRTLEALSVLAGEEEIVTRTLSAGQMSSDRPLVDLLSGGRPQRGESVSTQWRRRLPVDLITRGSSGHALAFDERNRPAWIPLTPYWSSEPWRSLRAIELDGGGAAPAARHLPPPERQMDPIVREDPLSRGIER